MDGRSDLRAQCTRRAFVGAAAAAALMGGSEMLEAAPRETSRRPDIVVIYCDDLGYGDLGCFGSETIRTPHLDRLAASGVRFTDWYSNSPVCSPSRASLLTGCYPERTGVTNILGGGRGSAGLAPEQHTLATLLKPHGYSTALFGKWHLGLTPECRPNAHGFDEFYGFMAGCVDYYSHIFYWGGGNPLHDLWHNETEVWSNGQYLTELITDKAVDYIRSRQADAPFFTYVAYNAPHYPMHAPRKYLDRYKGLPEDKRIMAAMVSAVDDGVGRIMAALKASGRLKDTVVFFSADNGPSTESRNWLDGTQDPYYGGSAGRFRGHKASLFEGGIREPAILCAPGRLPAGVVRSQACAMMDVLPTLLEMAGVDGAPGIDGRSILGVARDGAPSPHECLCWAYNGQTAVREGRWKLVLDGKLDFTHGQADAVHLADLEADPGERSNLASAEPQRVAALRERLAAWRASVGRSA